jgi:uncharacterized Tic20 family protein
MTEENQVYETPPAGVGPTGSAAREPNRDARMWAMFCHLAALAGAVIPAFGFVIGPLVVWLIKKDEFPFVDQHGKEALNFQISMLICTLLAVALTIIPPFCMGPLLVMVIGIVDLIFVIIAAIKANDGYHYRYPLSIQFVK